MNKRDFLKLISIMITGMTSGACVDAASGNASGKPRVLVIGAGLAGLAAARELHNQGYEVVVIEARDRIGGRLWTSTQWADMPVDLGASWIHGVKGNPLTDLAERIRARRLVTRYDKAITYNTRGKALSVSEDKRLNAVRKQVHDALKASQQANADASIRRVIEPLIRQFDPSSEAYRFINFILTDVTQ